MRQLLAILVLVGSTLAQPAIVWQKVGSTGKSQSTGTNFDANGNMYVASNDPTANAQTVYRSTDKGRTWSLFMNGITGTGGCNSFRTVNKAPNGDLFIVRQYCATPLVYYLPTGASAWVPAKYSGGFPAVQGVYSTCAIAHNNITIYCQTQNGPPVAHGTILISTDNARTWTSAPGAPGPVSSRTAGGVREFDYSWTVGGAEYITVNCLNDINSCGLWKSTDNALNWSRLPLPPGFNQSSTDSWAIFSFNTGSFANQPVAWLGPFQTGAGWGWWSWDGANWTARMTNWTVTQGSVIPPRQNPHWVAVNRTQNRVVTTKYPDMGYAPMFMDANNPSAGWQSAGNGLSCALSPRCGTGGFPLIDAVTTDPSTGKMYLTVK